MRCFCMVATRLASCACLPPTRVGGKQLQQPIEDIRAVLRDVERGTKPVNVRDGAAMGNAGPEACGRVAAARYPRKTCRLGHSGAPSCRMRDNVARTRACSLDFGRLA